MAGKLFEVTGEEPDLFSSHLWWVTNVHLLALSVTVNKTDGDQGAWRLGHNKGWMRNTNIGGVYIPVVIAFLTSEQSAVT